MSRLRGRIGWAVLLAALATPSAVAARQTDEELRQRLDSLRPLRDAADVAMRAALAEAERRRMEESTIITDTITVGPLKIVVAQGQQDEARRLFGEVWDAEYRPFLDAPARASSEYFTFAWPMAEGPIPVSGDDPVRRVEMRHWRSPEAVRTVIRKQIAAMLGAEISETPLGAWIYGEVRAPEDPGKIFRLTATAGAESTRSCLGGASDRCWDALAADLTLDPYPLDDWYSPDERVQLVRQGLDRGLRMGLERDARVPACLERRSIQACDAVLADRMTRWGSPGPLQLSGPRAHLVWLALHAGGRGAWARLTADPHATPGDALRAASGLGADALSELWRGDVMAHRPKPPRVLDPSLLVALAWVGVFASLGMRSTRWRLG